VFNNCSVYFYLIEEFFPGIEMFAPLGADSLFPPAIQRPTVNAGASLRPFPKSSLGQKFRWFLGVIPNISISNTRDMMGSRPRPIPLVHLATPPPFPSHESRRSLGRSGGPLTKNKFHPADDSLCDQMVDFGVLSESRGEADSVTFQTAAA